MQIAIAVAISLVIGGIAGSAATRAVSTTSTTVVKCPVTEEVTPAMRHFATPPQIPTTGSKGW